MIICLPIISNYNKIQIVKFGKVLFTIVIIIINIKAK